MNAASVKDGQITKCCHLIGREICDHVSHKAVLIGHSLLVEEVRVLFRV